MLVAQNARYWNRRGRRKARQERRSGGKKAGQRMLPRQSSALQPERRPLRTLKAKRKKGQKKEQANYQKIKARAAPRLGGRRKQIHEEFEAKVEE